jgi:UDP-3-O-[3-hydroxymyristoyl] glucosamine N-acyltransferase
VTVAELAARLGCEVEGDGTVVVTRVAAIDRAGPHDLTFLSNPRYASHLPSTRAGAILMDHTVTSAPCAILRTTRPYLALARAVDILTPPGRPLPGVSPLASIDPTATVGPDVSVGPFVAIGARVRIGARSVLASHVAVGADTTIGDDCVLHAHVSVREAVTIGSRVVIQDGAIVGSDGFGFAQREDGSHQKIPQVGRVVIEDDVEIGALAAVDRPAIGETRIGLGTKIDNLVQIAHGVTIGRHVLLAAQVGIAGSTELGDHVMMAGQSGAAGHLRLGHRAIVSAKSAVTKDVADAEHVAGIPAGAVAEWREGVVLVRRLPELRKAVADLEARLAALEARLMT